MIRKWLGRLLVRPMRPCRVSAGRARLAGFETPAALYAIGDVHGRLDLLAQIEAACMSDARTVAGTKIIVLLGDMIDRGPHSAQVLDHVLSAPPQGWRRLAIAGNHEAAFGEAMLDHRRFETWIGFGGLATLGSYGIGQREIQHARGSRERISELFRASIPAEHLSFLIDLPVQIDLGHFILTHAGGRPGIADSEQDDRDLLWYKGERTNQRDDGRILVHGHEIVEYPEIQPSRINVDTGAYSSGVLSAVRLLPGKQLKILQVRG